MRGFLICRDCFEIIGQKNFSKIFLKTPSQNAVFSAISERSFLKPFRVDLENFIIIHLIHSSGPEPGGQYALTACPVRGTKRGSP